LLSTARGTVVNDSGTPQPGGPQAQERANSLTSLGIAAVTAVAGTDPAGVRAKKYVPATQVFTDEETVVQINSTGPWGINYVNPKDDPRQKTQ
jgi:hypothetical protein